MIPVEHYLFVSAALFSLGIAVVLQKKNAVVILMGIELMLNAANLNLVAFSRYDPALLQGQMFSLFVMVIAAAEAAVGLAIILNLYRYFKTDKPDEARTLKG